MKIAITGANGFVGSHLTRYFIARGFTLYPIVRPGSDTSFLEGLCPLKFVNYNDPLSIKSALGDCDVLIHNAGSTRAHSMQDMYLANVQTTSQLIQTANEIKTLKHIILISSQAASAPSYNDIPVTENDKSNPLTWYGKSKYLAELVVKNTAHKDWTILRPCSVYGEGERDFLQLFKLLKSGLSFQLGNTDNPLNLIYIKELCEAIGLCVQNPKAYQQTFFLTDGKAYRQSDLVAAASSAIKCNPLKLKIPLPMLIFLAILGDHAGKLLHKPQLLNAQKQKEILAPGWLCSIEKARTLINWNPTPNLSQNIKETIEWYISNGWL